MFVSFRGWSSDVVLLILIHFQPVRPPQPDVGYLVCALQCYKMALKMPTVEVSETLDTNRPCFVHQSGKAWKVTEFFSSYRCLKRDFVEQRLRSFMCFYKSSKKSLSEISARIFIARARRELRPDLTKRN